MPFDCQFRATHGQGACVDRCPTTGTSPTFVFARVERSADLPRVEPHAIDVAVLDMHHGWPNLGHDAIAYGIQNIVCGVTPALRAAGLRIRVLSYDVRRGHQIGHAPRLAQPRARRDRIWHPEHRLRRDAGASGGGAAHPRALVRRPARPSDRTCPTAGPTSGTTRSHMASRTSSAT